MLLLEKTYFLLLVKLVIFMKNALQHLLNFLVVTFVATITLYVPTNQIPISCLL